MTRVIEFLISLAIVIVVFVVIALFLPAKRTVTHTVETNRPLSTVNDLLDGFARFKDWNLLIRYDPRMQITLSGPASGVGAKFSYVSNEPGVGSGSWEIIESVPGEKIVVKIENPARGANKTMTFRFEKTGQRKQNVKISQRYKVEYGFDLIGRYAGMYVTRNVGDDIRTGLDKLSNVMTSIPKFDYSFPHHKGEFKEMDVPAVNALVVTAASKRTVEDIATVMSNQMQWINQTMEKNGLESAGPMRIVTNEFTADSYGFDVVMPVRSKGTAPAPAEGEAAAPVVADPAAPLETLNITTDGANPVVLTQIPAMHVVTTEYTGTQRNLEPTRNRVKAWALVRGLEPWDRPYEEYLVAIPEIDSDEAKFAVYWPIKTADTVIAPPAPVEPAAEAAPAEPAAADAPAEAVAPEVVEEPATP